MVHVEIGTALREAHTMTESHGRGYSIFNLLQ